MCEQEKGKLANSHIYPKSMTKEGSQGKHMAAAMYRDGQHRVAVVRSGLTDKNICCHDCERLFAKPDEHAIYFRRAAMRGLLKDVGTYGEEDLPSLVGANPSLLHTFAMQTLLRCALSDREEHAAVPRDEVSNWISERILNGEPTIDDGPQVGIIITVSVLGMVALSPIYHAMPGSPMYDLGLPNMRVLIAATPNGLPEAFRPLVLRQNQPITIWHRKKTLPGDMERIKHAIGPNLDRMGHILGDTDIIE